MAGSTVATAAALVLMTGALGACSESVAEPGAAVTPSVTSSAPPPSASATETATESAAPPSGPAVSDGRPRRATLSIPALGLRDLVVVPYPGRTDDARGTRIQDGGVAASPHGPQGGVGPGGLGNYQVTAHRTSSTRAFAELPSLRVGQRVVVTAGGVRYVYEIRRTRETSFRSARSLAEQRAAVPGHPGASPTRAFLTLSTCATPEDHAEGNYWSDKFHNPEHRIDKIGVLVRRTG
ncbi:putative sortase (Surface protein transpeptidase) [metagenome]|uniref:Putative sortase (Surface protein transpeptidase) n=1 Tax=metagenome TaxID=256318 RepID=A0A2P2CD21_9ZZZZ